jgi:hypothetical protein
MSLANTSKDGESGFSPGVSLLRMDETSRG